MSKEIIFNCTEHETRVAVLEDRVLTAFYVERIDERSIAGNIYKGKVTRVIPGIQAAFVDIGLDRSAFLYVADIQEERSGINLRVNGDTDFIPYEEGRPQEQQSKPIEKLLKEGQEILVQVSKEPLGNKGARITTHISLAGRNLVAMPKSRHIAISRKIADEEERYRLWEIIQKSRPEQYGFIARTASEGKGEDELGSDFDYLSKLWSAISEKSRRTRPPGLIHRELDMTLRLLRDLYTQDVERIVVDSAEEHRELIDFMNSFMPCMKASIDFYKDTMPIFDMFGIEPDIRKLLDRKVWLKSGGYIIIEETETLCAIDVNTGKYVGRKNMEETILKTNLEAAREIAYQLRMRNIGGIIIIDFIDMEIDANRESVFNALKEEMKKDRNRISIQEISEIGLVEMTRQRRRKSLKATMCMPCPCCGGKGTVKTRTSISYEIFRELEREAAYDLTETLCALVHPEMATFILENKGNALKNLEKKLERKILVETDSGLHREDFKILPMQ